MATKIVGLDLGSHTVKLCEIVTTMRNFELVGFGTEAVDVPYEQTAGFEELASAARRLLERRGLTNETVMCSLPPGLASTVLLDLPFDQAKKIEAILPFQLEEAIPLDMDEVIYDYQIVKRGPDHTSTVLCAYAREADIADLLRALQEQSIDPKRISLGPLAYFNLYDHLIGPENTETVAILDLGHVHTELTVFDQGVPQIVREISTGGRDITAGIAEAFQVAFGDAERGKWSDGLVSFDPAADGLDEREALMSETCKTALHPLLTELKRSVAAHELETGHAVQKIYCTGGGSRLRGILKFLEASLRIPVEMLQPLGVHFNRLSADPEVQGPLIAKSMALSVQAFARVHRDQVNLRQGEYMYTGDFGFMRGRIITVALAVLLMIAMGAMVAITKKRVLEAEHGRLRTEVNRLSQEILGADNEDVDLLLTTVSEDKEAADRGIPEHSALRLLAQISDGIDPDIKVDVDRIELDLDRKTINVRGKTGSAADVDRIVDALRQNRCFRRAKSEGLTKSVDDRTRFKLSVSLTCS